MAADIGDQPLGRGHGAGGALQQIDQLAFDCRVEIIRLDHFIEQA